MCCGMAKNPLWDRQGLSLPWHQVKLTSLEEKKNYTAGFLILEECNQPVKMNKSFWSQPKADSKTFAFQCE